MQIVHRSGNRHSNADGLSRIPDKLEPCDCYHAGAHLKSLPCGGYSYCSRACQQWERISEDVDNVVPLAIKTPEPPGNVAAILIADKAIPTGDLNCEINWAETRPREELSKLQHEDGDLSVLFQWLEEPPTSHDLLLSSPASRSYWMCKNQLIVRDGLIFYAWLNDSQRRLCLLVPKAMQQEVLHCCHDMKSSAHLGQDKTLQRAKQHYMWYRMSQDCREYVQSCSVCNKNKKSSVKPKAPL